MLPTTTAYRSFFNTLVQKNLDSILVFDQNLQVCLWNETLERLSGLGSSYAIGKHLFDVCPFMKQIGELAFISKALTGEEALSKNRPFYFTASNSQGFFEGNYFPIANEFGIVEEVLCIFKDSTEVSQFDENLIHLTESLRKKLLDRTEELVNANIELKEEVKKRRRFGFDVLLKNIEMTDSILYAKEIQNAIFPPLSKMQDTFGDMLLFFKPRDIVSGDFYWYHRTDCCAYLAAVDCTGHGVPGALISILGYNALNQAINEQKLKKPGDILQYLDHSVSNVFKSTQSSVRDGMDVSLIKYNITARTIEFAGAMNPLFIVRDGELIKVKGDRHPIGPSGNDSKSFENHEIKLQSEDCVYLFTDGYPDQFGGSQGKKMKYDLFKRLLMDCQKLSFSEQLNLVERTFKYWQGDLEQVDDVLVLGFRVE
jgi:PAS domain S-box-containing protein